MNPTEEDVARRARQLACIEEIEKAKGRTSREKLPLSGLDRIFRELVWSAKSEEEPMMPQEDVETTTPQPQPAPEAVAVRLKLNKKRSKATRPKAGRHEVMRGERPPM